MAQRLTFVIHSLTTGGAERVMAQLAGGMAQRGHDVTLITLDSADSDTYNLSGSVHRVALDVMRESRNPFEAVINNIGRLRRLRQAIRDSRPDKVVSFTDKTNIITLLACWGTGFDVVISERVSPRLHPIGNVWNRLRRITYPRCRALVVQTEGIARQLSDAVRGRPIVVIPNGIDPAACVSDDSRRPYNSDAHLIVAMGRLDPQKGFDLLIEAFSKIAADFPDWKIRILGEGAQRPSLEQLIRDRQLEDRVQLAGWISDPLSVLSEAGFFVLSSRYEGFPNSLLEAMACGLPVVSFDCNDGPGQIIRHEVDGLLVPDQDVAALAEALARLISDPTLRQRLAEQVPEVTKRFSQERFITAWEQLLDGGERRAERGEPERK